MMLKMIALAGALFTVAVDARAEVVRHPIPNSNFPIAQVVEV